MGANGSGKTRLAAWLDLRNGSKTAFIRASRDIRMPSNYSIVPEDEQLASINAGQPLKLEGAEAQKRWRYQNAEYPFVSSDFSSVMNILGTRHATASNKFRISYNPKAPPPQLEPTELERAVEIWQKCLPHLKITFEEAPKIEVHRTEDQTEVYEPSEMSDGERAIFYLVGRCLIADKGSLILVDEPEMYLHPSIRNILWDEIELARSDCAFLYFTHDLDFCTGRKYEKRIVINWCRRNKSLDKTDYNWDYQFVETFDDIPDNIALDILGTRQKFLLIEGDQTSLDRKIAFAVYPDFRLRFSGGCDEVIRHVKALHKDAQFLHKDVYGLIDADFRSPEQLDELRSKRIYSHSLREIENLMVASKTLAAILENLGKFEELDERLGKIMATTKAKLSKVAETIIDKIVLNELKRAAEVAVRMKNLKPDQHDELNEPDWPKLNEIREQTRTRVNVILVSGDWDEMLRIFSARKQDFLSIVASNLGYKNWGELESTIIAWLSKPNSEHGKRILEAMKSYMPTITGPVK